MIPEPQDDSIEGSASDELCSDDYASDEGFDEDSDEDTCEVPDEEKTPFVILLGYLGAGKTTLVNNILRDQKDLKICVIENEFGAVSIDNDLVSENVRATEDVITLENGCTCCTIRGDLVETLIGFSEHRKVFDYILLETTGLADPSPIISTLNQESHINRMYRIDSIICIVDAKHIGMQLNRVTNDSTEVKVNEAAQQLAFADRILLNKTDLVTLQELDEVKKQIVSINMFAEIIETKHSKAPMSKFCNLNPINLLEYQKHLLGVSSFNLERLLELLENEIEVDSEKSEKKGESEDCSHHQHQSGHDVCGGCSSCNADETEKSEKTHVGEKRKVDCLPNGQAELKKQKGTNQVISTRHSNKVGSIGLVLEGSFDLNKFNELMGKLLEQKAEDIYRFKGVLSFDGEPHKFVFQGVHEQIICEPSSHQWDDVVTPPGSCPEPRVNKIVFIGHSSEAPRNSHAANMVGLFKCRPRMVPVDRREGKFMEQLAREIFDVEPSKTYDLCGPTLGEGSYGSVMIVQHKTTGEKYAMKSIDISEFSDLTLHLLRNEIDFMKYLIHPNIVRLQEVYQLNETKKIYLIMEKLEGGTVRQRWRDMGCSLPENYCAYIISGIVSAVRYCHDRNIVHRDLKMDNALFESKELTSIIKVIDFGLSERFSDDFSEAHEVVGTKIFVAPEVFSGSGYGLECDMWSVGVIAYCILCDTFPFYNDDSDVLISSIKYSRYSFPSKKMSPLAKDFIDRCLRKKPKKRLTAKQAQSHPWMNNASCWVEEHKTELKKSQSFTRNIINFPNNSLFRQIGMEVVAYSLNTAEIHELVEEFKRSDVDGDGSLSLSDFKAILIKNCKKLQKQSSADRSLHNAGKTQSTCDGDQANAEILDISEDEVEKIFNSLDIDHSGSINFNEFIAGCLGSRSINENIIKSAFDKLDYDRKGAISLDDLKMYVGMDVSNHKLESAIRDVDTDGDGLVSFEEFERAMHASICCHNIERAMQSLDSSLHVPSATNSLDCNAQSSQWSESSSRNTHGISRLFRSDSVVSFKVVAMKAARGDED